MKLILHIGTHKTATTSIQHFCTFNKANMIGKGVYYALRPTDLYHVNSLASDAVRGRWDSVTAFVNSATQEAKDANCHTLFMSGESFYAMTGIFLDAYARPHSDDYWAHEAKLVNRFAEIFSQFEEVTIACSFRTQDGLAGSLYNQFVKSVQGTADDYLTFTSRIINVFDYQGHIKLWQAAFPQAKFVLVHYPSNRNDMIDAFIGQVLGPDIVGATNHMDNDLRANERLDRDLLEYKRHFNAMNPDKCLSYMAVTCFRRMANPKGDEAGFYHYATLAQREALFGQFQVGNDALCAVYKLPPLPVIRLRDEPTYQGLSEQRFNELDKQFKRMMRHPRRQLELVARRIVNRRDGIFPRVKQALQPLRIALLKARLRFAGW